MTVAALGWQVRGQLDHLICAGPKTRESLHCRFSDSIYEEMMTSCLWCASFAAKVYKLALNKQCSRYWKPLFGCNVSRVLVKTVALSKIIRPPKKSQARVINTRLCPAGLASSHHHYNICCFQPNPTYRFQFDQRAKIFSPHKFVKRRCCTTYPWKQQNTSTRFSSLRFMSMLTIAGKISSIDTMLNITNIAA